MSGFKRKPLQPAEELTQALRGHAGDLPSATGRQEPALQGRVGEGGRPRTVRKTVQLNINITLIAIRSIPHRAVLARWSNRGLSKQATLAGIDDARLPRPQQHLFDLVSFQKMTVSGVVPTIGLAGIQIDSIIEELRGLDAIPAKLTRTAA